MSNKAVSTIKVKIKKYINKRDELLAFAKESEKIKWMINNGCPDMMSFDHDLGMLIQDGSQYSSYEYKKVATKHNIILSMSRRGNCYDNAVAESFFKTIKKELVRKEVFLTRDIATAKIFEYIEMFYNSKRRHSYLGYISPNQFEKQYNEKSLNN